MSKSGYPVQKQTQFAHWRDVHTHCPQLHSVDTMYRLALCKWRPLTTDDEIVQTRIEQDQRAIKCIVKPMAGFKDFRYAPNNLAGNEAMHVIRTGQMNDNGFTRSAAEKILFSHYICIPNQM